MNDLTPHRGFLASRSARNVGRELSRLDGSGRLEMARLAQEADLQAERVSAVGYVAKRSLHEVAMLSQLEVQLAALVPAATPRLQGLGDVGALAIADVLSETVRRVK
jgi:hypothetical protein